MWRPLPTAPTSAETARPQRKDPANRSPLAAPPVERRVRREASRTTAFRLDNATDARTHCGKRRTPRLTARAVALSNPEAKARGHNRGKALRSVHRSVSTPRRRRGIRDRDVRREGESGSHGCRHTLGYAETLRIN
jgi:hypothetical protein